jgi:hypothetical protein
VICDDDDDDDGKPLLDMYKGLNALQHHWPNGFGDCPYNTVLLELVAVHVSLSYARIIW